MRGRRPAHTGRDRALADCRQGFSGQRMVDNFCSAAWHVRARGLWLVVDRALAASGWWIIPRSLRISAGGTSAPFASFLKPKSPLKFFVFQHSARQRYSLASFHPNYRTSMLEGRRLPCVRPTRCRYPSPSAPHAACLPPAACESEGWVRAARACIRA